MIDAVDGVPDFTAEQKAGVKGFAKTIQAQDLLMVVDIMDSAGAVTQFDVDPSAPLPPIDTRDNALKRVSDLLDEGKTLLLAAGSIWAITSFRAHAQGARNMNYIDAHVHVWTPDTVRYPLAPGYTKENMKPASFTAEAGGRTKSCWK